MSKYQICSKVCWDLMELTERQATLIARLTLRVRELETILEIESQVVVEDGNVG